MKSAGIFLKSSKGQITVEYLLLTVVSVILVQMAFSQIRKSDMLKSFVSGPNPAIANMLENGNWSLSNQEAKTRHPNQIERHFSWDP